MHKRLDKWMKYEGLKPSELADKIGVNRATISHVLSGRNKPSIDFLQKLLDSYSNLNANWLIRGVGQMHDDKNAQNVKLQKKISRIIVFYEDRSFDELKS